MHVAGNVSQWTGDSIGRMTSRTQDKECETQRGL